jgi:hypothetical protein
VELDGNFTRDEEEYFVGDCFIIKYAIIFAHLTPRSLTKCGGKNGVRSSATRLQAGFLLSRHAVLSAACRLAQARASTGSTTSSSSSAAAAAARIARRKSSFAAIPSPFAAAAAPAPPHALSRALAPAFALEAAAQAVAASGRRGGKRVVVALPPKMQGLLICPFHCET